jgi:hypothetical protein
MKTPVSLGAAHRLLPLLILPLASLALAQQHAHTHGQLTIDVAIDAQTLTVSMEAPLDNFLGFERAPRTDAERKSVSALVNRLNAADKLFIPNPQAECRLSSVTLESDTLGLKPGEPAAKGGDVAAKATEVHDEHADIDVSIVFTCAKAPLARQLDVRMFEAFPRLRTINAQVASAQGQFKRKLTKAAPALRWGR